MAYDFSNLQNKIKDIKGWLSGEFKNIQTGRATPAVLDSVMVSSYGSKIHIKEIATIIAEDARTLKIEPWDKDNIGEIEVAVRELPLGLGVSVDDTGIRVSFPLLTEETREKYIKVVRGKLEEAKISLRGERDDVWDEIQKLEKKGEIGKDDRFRYKEEMEKIAKKAVSEFEELAEKKERELKS